MRRTALLAVLTLMAAACGGDGSSTTTTAAATTVAPTTTEVVTTTEATTTTAAATTTEAPTTTTSSPPPIALGGDPPTFDDVLAVWSAGGTTDAATIYAPDATVIDIETVSARGIEEIAELAAISRDNGSLGMRVASPTVVFETDAGGYAVAAVETHESGESLGSLEIVVLKWAGGGVVAHWRLPVPGAVPGTYRNADNVDALALAERMAQAWDSGDISAAQDVYAADVRVHWFGESSYEGLEELLATIEGAHGIGNSYKSIATPTVIIETESGRTYAVSVMNVTGPGHPQGSLVIAFSEIGEGGIVAWGPFFVEDLPPN